MKLMKREAAIHLTSLVLFFLFLSLLKGWYTDFRFLWFWLGGIFGAFLLDIDHLVYSLFLNPHELTSQRVAHLVKQRRFQETADLLARTKHERTKVILHSIEFEAVFLILALFVITSSGSLFGVGLVLGVMTHFLVDQFFDLQSLGHLNNWFRQFPIRLEKKDATLFWIGSVLVVLLLGVML